VLVVASKRNLTGSDKVQVVVVQVVDLVGVLAEESGALHDVRAHQSRGDERHETVFEGGVERVRHQRDLETRADTLEEVEACARNLRAAFHIDRAEQFTELKVVAGGKVKGGNFADVAKHNEVFFAAGRYTVNDDVFDAAE